MIRMEIQLGNYILKLHSTHLIHYYPTPSSATNHTSTHLTPSNPDLHHFAARTLFAITTTATDLEQGLKRFKT